jgi:hypothetical protein
MSRPHPNLRRAAARTASTLLVASLPGCLTTALWSSGEPDRSLDYLSTIVTPLQVDSVEATGTAANADHLRVRFELSEAAASPAEPLRRFGAGQRGVLDLVRPDPLAISQDLRRVERPRAFAIGAFDGQHRSSGHGTGRVTFFGEYTDSTTLGRRVEPAELPTELLDRPPIEGTDPAETPWAPDQTWASRAIRGLRSHRWTQLLAPGERRSDETIEPIAWRTGGGRELTQQAVDRLIVDAESDPVARRIAHGTTLLARLSRPVEPPLWFEIPLSVLLDAEHTLYSRRDDGSIRYARHEYWDLTLATEGQERAMPGAATYDLPRVGGDLLYAFSEIERPTDLSPALVPIKIALTPISALVDFLVSSNQSLRNVSLLVIAWLHPEAFSRFGPGDPFGWDD